MQSRGDCVSQVAQGQKLQQLTCCNDEVHRSVGCASQRDDVVDPEVSETRNEGHGASQSCSKDD